MVFWRRIPLDSHVFGWLRILGLVWAGWLASGCKPVTAPVADANPRKPEEFLLGMCHASTPAMVATAQGAGSWSVRNSLVWRHAEPAPGYLRLPAAYRRWLGAVDDRGMTPLVPVAYSNPLYDGGGYPESPEAVAAFARFAGFAAVATKPERAIMEIWNEWNLGIGMPGWAGFGSPESYVTALRAAYREIKSVRPDALVLGGVMAGAGITDDWTLRACEAGMLEHLDGISFHPYCYWMMGRDALPETGMMFLVDSVEEILSRFPGGDEIPFYLTEMGWPTHRGEDRVTLEEQAQFASRMLILTRAHPRIRGVWWFNLQNRPNQPQDVNYHFGLLQSDGRPKPAWFAFRDTARLIRETQSARIVEDFDDQVRVVELVLNGGERAIAVWTVEPDGESLFHFSGGWRGRTTQQIVGSGRAGGVHMMSVPDGRFQIRAGNMPVVVRGLRSGASVDAVAVAERASGYR